MADLRIAMLGTKVGQTINVKVARDQKTDRIRNCFPGRTDYPSSRTATSIIG